MPRAVILNADIPVRATESREYWKIFAIQDPIFLLNRVLPAGKCGYLCNIPCLPEVHLTSNELMEKDQQKKGRA